MWITRERPKIDRIACPWLISKFVDSEAEFIVEHYWAYTALPRGRAREHFVVHPPWHIASATRASLEADVGELYGDRFAPFLSRRPESAFWADGSLVRAYRGARPSRVR